MENKPEVQAPTPNLPSSVKTKTNNSHKATTLFIVLFVVLAAGILGTYFWQHNKVKNLQSELTSSKATKTVSTTTTPSKTTTNTQTQSSTFTYTPQTAGFSLVLPKTYEVLVGADGNDGGAAGFDFKVVPITSTNVSTDQVYTDEAEIQTGDNQSLSAAVSSAETQMQQNGDCSTLSSASCDTTDFSTSDTTIGGQPAKLITATAGNEYQGYVNVYVVVYGNWGYTITSNNVSTSAGSSSTNVPGTLLSAVLKGISLKVAPADNIS